ncbi:hypothetical protein FRB94_000129 [Tulasnella sp. JGI-2019a]|nr:hypothetical protein FRB94_000129 [Tulasnella sp. JGI-2019a]
MSTTLTTLYTRFNTPDSSPDSITNIITNPSLYVEVVRRSPWDCYTALIGAVLTIWDLLTTLDSEVAFIWRSRSTLTGKPLYLFIRYAGTAYQVYDCAVNLVVSQPILVAPMNLTERYESCTTYYVLLPIFTATLLYAMDLLLAYRALCLYRMSRKLVIFNIAFFTLCAFSTAILLGLAYSNFEAIDTPAHLKGCWSLISSFVTVSQFPGLIFELWLFAMVSYRVIVYSKAARLWSRKGIVQLMIMDSLSWFASITFMLVLNTIGLGLFPMGMRTMGLPLFRGVIIVAGCHMIIHMRKASFHEAETALDSDLTTTRGPSRNVKTRSVQAVFTKPTDPESFGTSRPQRRPPILRQTISGSPSNTSWLGRVLRIAQRLGLPPPLKQDLDTLWVDAVVTINRPPSQDIAEEQVELSYMDTTTLTAGSDARVSRGRDGMEGRLETTGNRMNPHLWWVRAQQGGPLEAGVHNQPWTFDIEKT